MAQQRFGILAVDDEPSVAQSISFALAAPTRNTSVAANGREALAKIDASPDKFDVVITDNNMPGIGGLELVRNLRARDFAGKIVVLSAYLSEDIRRAYTALKVDGMIAKPFDVRELRLTVERLSAA